MIADDIVAMIYRDGNPTFASELASGTCVQVPFLFRRDQEKLDALCPIVNGNIAAPWARPVYDRLILVDSAQESIVVVESVPTDDVTGGIAAPGTDPLADDDAPAWSAMAVMINRHEVSEGHIAKPRHVARLMGFKSGRVTRVSEADEIQEASTRRVALLRGMAAQSMPQGYLPFFDSDLSQELGGHGGLPPLGPVEIEMFLAGRLLSIVATTLALLCCKNIETVDRPAPRQVRRAAERGGRPKPFTVKTLVVKPLQKRKSEPGETVSQEPLALHWVRGHFKSYSEDRPLFGRVAGTFWWTPHLAGDVQAGVVVKDYKIETGEEG